MLVHLNLPAGAFGFYRFSDQNLHELMSFGEWWLQL